MRRRDLITLVGASAVAWPLAARAQQPDRLRRIGILGDRSLDKVLDAFLAGLRELGYVEGKNLHIEFRFAEGDDDRLPRLATELVALNVDVIVTWGKGTYAAHRATATIPIVMAAAADVVAMGIVASLAHPGGNITGLTLFVPEIMAKRLELLKEVVPPMARSGVLLRRNTPSTGNILEVMEVTAKELRVELQPIEVGGPEEFESAFSALTDKQTNAIIVQDLLTFDAAAIAALAAKHRLPSIGPVELPASGGLMAYGVNFPDMFHRAAYFVDKILKGTKPGDIPIEQATKFKLVLNLKTAKVLGLTVPPILLATADEVIE